MQLVVEISEDTFFDLKKKQNRTEVDNAVLQGTPLPKGHDRLIDAKVAYRKFYARCLAGVAKEVLDLVPTIIEADCRECKAEHDCYECKKYEESEISIPYLMHKEMDIPISECHKAYDIAIDYLRSQGKVKG